MNIKNYNELYFISQDYMQRYEWLYRTKTIQQKNYIGVYLTIQDYFTGLQRIENHLKELYRTMPNYIELDELDTLVELVELDKLDKLVELDKLDELDELDDLDKLDELDKLLNE